jgi:hypothetical protein
LQEKRYFKLGRSNGSFAASNRQSLALSPILAILCSFALSASFAVKYLIMCRNIKTLFNFDPPVTPDEIHAASVQFVRKITGFNKPSKANEEAFDAAIADVAGICTRLLQSLETTAPPKNREEEAAKARARAAERFGT